jgi:hypothetical protein
MGLIAAGSLTDGSFTRLLQTSAVLFVGGAVVSGAIITNPTVAESFPCEVAAMCRDRGGAQPALASRR